MSGFDWCFFNSHDQSCSEPDHRKTCLKGFLTVAEHKFSLDAAGLSLSMREPVFEN